MSSSPRPVLDEDAVWAATDRERSSLADLLADLRDDEWEAASLCAGWRVRDVAAHLALAHIGTGTALAALARARGSFDRMVHDTALRHAVVPPAQLVAEIRAMVGSRRTVPVISSMEPLLDVLVHGQDIAVPLGRPREMPVDAAAAAATRIWTMSWPLSAAFGPRRRLRGLELVATDADWRAGAGAQVTGPIAALLLLLTGRTAVAVPRLSGPGAARLALSPERRQPARR